MNTLELCSFLNSSMVHVNSVSLQKNTVKWCHHKCESVFFLPIIKADGQAEAVKPLDAVDGAHV
jgi:hypothetical protein